MKAVTWHGKRDVRVDTVPDPAIQEPTDAIIRVTSTGHLRLRPAPVRGARRRSSTPGDILGHEPMGIVEEVGGEVTELSRRRPRGRAVQHLLRHLLHVRPGPALAVRDDPGARARHGRLAVRLHEALRPGAGRAGRVPARAVRQHAADQGAGGAGRRPLRLPLRRPADGLAGGASTPGCRTAAALVVLGLGPIGDMATRIALHRGATA